MVIPEKGYSGRWRTTKWLVKRSCSLRTGCLQFITARHVHHPLLHKTVAACFGHHSILQLTSYFHLVARVATGAVKTDDSHAAIDRLLVPTICSCAIANHILRFESCTQVPTTLLCPLLCSSGCYIVCPVVTKATTTAEPKLQSCHHPLHALHPKYAGAFQLCLEVAQATLSMVSTRTSIMGTC
jgi:hypothetical protein